MASIRVVPTTPFQGQRPGTSGLRKKTREFMQPHYLENFVQATLDATELAGKTLVVGGDGRYFNREAIQTILKLAAGNGVGRVLVAKDGILSTPAVSCVIRAHGAAGGLVLSASHNPGGIDADFGIKFNASNGGPAPEDITERIYRRTLEITEYRVVDGEPVQIDQKGVTRLGDTEVVVIDPLEDYVALMQRIFDFDRLREFLRGPFRMRFDAMNGVTGPFATAHIRGVAGRACWLSDSGNAAGGFRRGASGSEPDVCGGTGGTVGQLGRTGFRGGLRWRRGPESDSGAEVFCEPGGFAGDHRGDGSALYPCLSRWARGTRAIHADQHGRGSSGGVVGDSLL